MDPREREAGGTVYAKSIDCALLKARRALISIAPGNAGGLMESTKIEPRRGSIFSIEPLRGSNGCIIVYTPGRRYAPTGGYKYGSPTGFVVSRPCIRHGAGGQTLSFAMSTTIKAMNIAVNRHLKLEN